MNPQIPAAFEDVVAHCLAKDPTKRYQRAGELAQALRAVIRGEQPQAPAEQSLPDETIVTRDEKSPTMEMPRPGGVAADTASGFPVARSGGAGSVSTAVSAARPSSPLKRRIAAPVFFGIIGLLLLGLAGSVVALRNMRVDVPAVDTAAEAKRERERRIRKEANTLLRQGRVNDAYVKYEELQRMAPQSPFALTMLQKLSTVREQQEVGRQQVAQAQQKFDEGIVYFNAKRYPEAVELFQEAFSLNPNSLEAAEYLRLAQIEELKARVESEAIAASSTAAPLAPVPGGTEPAVPAGGSPTPAATPSRPVSSGTATLNTVFNHEFTDGRVVVRVGSDIVANENLFTEKPGRMFRKPERASRPVNTTRQFPSKNADLQVWVIIPAVGIQEHHVMQAVRFDAGSSQRLTIQYDSSTRRFAYDLH